MTKRTRLFMGFAVGVLIVGLGTGFLTSYYGLPALAQFGSDGPAELAYVPQDSRLIAFANVRDVMDSELRRKIMDLRTEPSPDQPSGADASEDLFEQAGIDIERDVDRILATLSGPAEAERERPLLLARGRFDDDLIETLARQRGAEVGEHRGIRVITHTTPEHAMALAFVEPDLVAVGTADAVRRAIDTKAGAVPDIRSNEEVMTLVRDIDAGNAWAVGRFDAIRSRTPIPQEIAASLPAISWFAATGHINGGIEGVIRAEARDDAAAQDLREVIQGFLALARLQGGQHAQFRALTESLQLGGTGKTVSLAFSVPSAVIDALAALHQQRRNPPVPRT
jgi:hypothetical protein